MLSSSTSQTASQRVAVEQEMVLEIHYPLMQGARIKGKVKLAPHEVKGVERHRIIQDLFIKMADKLSSHGKSDDQAGNANKTNTR